MSVYVLLTAGFYFVGFGLELVRYQSLRFILEPLAWASFSAALAIIAMSRLSIWVRIKFFFALYMLKLLVNAVLELLSLTIHDLGWPQLQLYEFVRLSIRDLRDFAVVIAVAHAISTMTTVFVSSNRLASIDAERVLQGRIVDWLYFVAFLSLAFLTQLPEPRLSYNPEHEIVFSTRRSGLTPEELMIRVLELAPKLGAAATGLFCLSPIFAWRVKGLMIVLIVAQSVLCMTYAFSEHFPLANFLLIFSCAAFISFPYWILLRFAGYRLYSPRKWSDSAGTLQSSSSIAPVMESPIR